VIDWTAAAKQILNALIAGHVSRHRLRTQRARGRIQAVGVAGGDDDFSPFTRCEFSGRKTDA
jgi:hypothetical protein